MENIILKVLVLTAIVLLVTLTGGVAYLTAIDWSDRRRRENDKRVNK